MIFISHVLLSVFILRILSLQFSSIPFNTYTLLFSAVVAILPDLDILWAKNLHMHRKTFFHAPLFWIVLFLMSFTLDKVFNFFPVWMLSLFTIQILVHLLLDYCTGRSAGIFIFYPFSNKEYSLFPLNKNKGIVHPSELKQMKPKNMITTYCRSKEQIAFEVLSSSLGMIALVV